MSTEQWRGIVFRYYGKRFVSVSWRIWMDVWCVVNGIKLAWLVDYLPLDVTKMRQLLEDSVSAGVFTIQDHSLAILMLNSDLLVINTAMELATPPTTTMFIDISTKLDKLVVVSECEWEHVSSAVREIQRAITSAAAGKSCAGQLVAVTEVTLAQDVNLSTVFGWLLGYPVVYWFDNSSPSSWDDCVSRLVRYTVIVSNAQVSMNKSPCCVQAYCILP